MRHTQPLSPTARALIERRAARAEAVAPAISAGPPGPAPLTSAQQRVWFFDRLEPGSGVYHLSKWIRLRGELDVGALESALAQLVERHEILRTRYDIDSDGTPMQIAVPAVPVALPWHDHSSHDTEEAERRARAACEADARLPFDHRTGACVRAALHRLGARDHVLNLTFHHIGFDGWSTGTAIRDLAGFYDAAVAGREPVLPPMPIQYRDYARWQRSRLTAGAHDADIAHWVDRLRGAPAEIELPSSAPRGVVPDYHGARETRLLPRALRDALLAFANGQGATSFMTVLTAFEILLSRLSGGTDLVLGVAVAGRTRSELEPLVGFLANMLPLRVDLSGDPTLAEALRRVRGAAVDAIAHHEVPLDRLVAELTPERARGATPLYNVLFNYRNLPAAPYAMSGLDVEVESIFNGRTPLDLMLDVAESDDGFRCSIDYRPGRLPPYIATKLLDRLQMLLESFIGGGDRPISELPVLLPGEAPRLIARAQGESRERPDLRVHERISEQAERTPRAVAVIGAGERLTYAELEARASRLARRLHTCGIRKGDIVGVFLDRSPDFIVALLGVLKAGAAYMPLDLDLPGERVEFMIDDSGAAAVVTNATFAHTLPPASATRIVDIAAEARGRDRPPSGSGNGDDDARVEPADRLTDDDLAYVIYTSGSTGRPKAVAITHRGVGNFVASVCELYDLDARDRVLQLMSLGFDASITEIFPALVAGATVVQRTPWMLDSVPRFLEGCDELRATVIATPAAFWHELVTAMDEHALRLPERVRIVSSGGESMSATALEAWRRRVPPGVRLFNVYGPTEAAVRATVQELTDAVDGERAVVPIGRPIPNVEVYVVDERLGLVPPGFPGELIVGGVGVARGYVGRPDLTAERFVPHPFRDGGRVYRTGDRARAGDDGVITFLGRRDTQLKVRGYRVEPGEIEAALLSHPGVAAAVVATRPDANGHANLVAFVVSHDVLAAPAVTELEDLLRRRLPPHMLPSAFEFLDHLPRTPTGKIDRNALAETGARALGVTRRGPATPTQRAICDIWAEVLAVPHVGLDDDFFALGGHSLLSMRACGRLESLLGVEVPLGALFDNPTPALLGDALDGRAGNGSRANATSVRPAAPARYDVEGPAPLSFAQRRLWFMSRLAPDDATYNMPVAMRLRGPLDTVALERSLRTLVERHEVLRTTFDARADEPVQRIRSIGEGFDFAIEDLARPFDEPITMREARLNERLAREIRLPFDLECDLPLRTRLYRISETDHVLLICMHHVAGDARSLAIVFREMADAYHAFQSGGAPAFEPVALRYTDFARWQREHESALAAGLEAWRKRLDGAEPLELPVDRRPREAMTRRGALLEARLDADLVRRVESIASRYGCTPHMALLAAWHATMARFTGQDDIVVGTPVAGRARPELNDVVGFFVNMLPIRARVDADAGYGALLGTIRAACVEAFAHQDVPFEWLIDSLRLERSPGAVPLIRTSFALQDEPDAASAFESTGLDVVPIELHNGTTKLDLAIRAARDGAEIRLRAQYDADCFDALTIQRILAAFARLLDAAVQTPDRPIGRLTILTEAERGELIRLGRGPRHPIPDAGVHELIAACAARQPEAVAVICDEVTLSYAELDARAERLANLLRERGAGRGATVAIFLNRSERLVVALLGVMKSGAAFLPLDPVHPAERIAFMLRDAGASLVVTETTLAGRLPVSAPLAIDMDDAVLDVESSDGSTPDAERPRDRARPDDLVYVLYTSGSTGQPKGVEIEHRSLTNYILRIIDATRVGADDRMLQFASITFDAAYHELFPALILGGSVVIRTDAMIRSIRAFIDACETHRLTYLCMPTAFWHEFVAGLHRDGLRWPAAVHALSMGGEAARADILALWRRVVPAGTALFNNYGPTEATITVTVQDLTEPVDGETETVPIGPPLGNADIRILDRAGELVPRGVAGELFVGGVCVARGYRDRPELTAARFVPDPFAEEPGARMYCTGDRARYRSDGSLDFLGRFDDQIKIRGYRIEPREIEFAIGRHPDVRGVAVLVSSDAHGDASLVAYVVGADAATLRRHLRRLLPSYMVPASFVAVDRIPLTAAGKVDRRALAASQPPALAHATAAEPRSQLATALCDAWAYALRVGGVGIHDDFFSLGGNSLLAMKAIFRASEAAGMNVPLRALFDHPTPAGLAAWIAGHRAAAQAATRPATRSTAPAAHDVPLSPAQRRLWFLNRLAPDDASYNVPIALRLSGALDVAALERALREIVRRHEVLRTVIDGAGSAPAQRVRPVPDAVMNIVPAAGDEEDVLRVATKYAKKPFDLAAELPFDATLYRVSNLHHLLLLRVHHIAIDGASMPVLFDELADFYDAFRRGVDPSLPEPPMRYAAHAAERSALESDGSLEYWRETLAGVEPLELPADRPRSRDGTRRGASIDITIDAATTAGLDAIARRCKATPLMALLAATQMLLNRITGQHDFVIGTPTAGRIGRNAERVIGFFVNTLPIRADFADGPSFTELLGRVRERVLDALAHDDAQFDRIVGALQARRSTGRNPIADVVVGMEDDDAAPPRLVELDVERVRVSTDTAKFDLSLTAARRDGALRVRAIYAANLFDEATAHHWLRMLAGLIAAAVAGPDRAIDELDVLGSDERRILIGEWGGSARAHVPNATVTALFRKQAERTPDAVAIEDGEFAISYRELSLRGERLAERLRRDGVRPGDRVGISMRRGTDTVVAMLAVLEAGAAYVPLDPEYPYERLAFMVRDAGIAVVLADEIGGAALAGIDATLLVNTKARTAGRTRDDGGDPRPAPLVEQAEIAADKPAGRERGSPEDLAYIMYTSGSTGTPKGVAIPHRGIVRLVIDSDYVRIRSDDRIAHAATTSFDAATFEIWGALLKGAAVVVLPHEHLIAPRHLAEDLRRLRVTTLFLTTALFNRIAAEVPDAFGEMRHILTGGEAADARAFRAVLESGAPPDRLVHVYGPTENTTFSTWWLVVGVPTDATTLPIGTPIRGSTAYVLDDRTRPAPIGVWGELCVGGAGVALGYHARPELTDERFLPDPFVARPGARLYRTGDRVRWTAAGVLEFGGRLDRQFKLRGFRIEPAEVEATLRGSPEVEAAAVIVDGEGDECRLVGYVAAPADLDVEMLRARLSKRLPSFMVPARIVVLDRLPLTANGKLDRAALPVEHDRAPSESAFTGRDPLEWQIGVIWTELLPGRRIGVHDDFFELGGHSLLALDMLERLERVTGRAVGVAALFEQPTIAGLAETLLRADTTTHELAGRTAAGGRDGGVVQVRAGDAGAVPFIFFHGDFNGRGLYARPIFESLDPRLPLYLAHPHETDGASSVDAMADDRLAEIRRLCPNGPYVLAGHCNGAIVAYEVARRLAAAGETVLDVVLIDANTTNLGYAPLETAVHAAGRALGMSADARRAAFARTRRLMIETRRQVASVWHAVRRAVRRRTGHAPEPAAALGAASVASASDSQPSDRARRAAYYARVLDGYAPRRYAGRVTVLMSDSVPRHRRRRILARWERLTEGVRAHDIPGEHLSAITAHAESLGRLLSVLLPAP